MVPVSSNDAASGVTTLAHAVRTVARASDRASALASAVQWLEEAGATVMVAPLDADDTTLAAADALPTARVTTADHLVLYAWDHPQAAHIVSALTAVVDSHPPAEESLFEERQQALSQLTSGLAHEVNNPLAAVLANLELARRNVADRLKHRASYSWLDELYSELDDARLAADRIHQIVRQLRLFHRPRTGRDDCELRLAVDCVLQFQGRALRSRARFHREDPCDHRVAASVNHVTHALFSLLSHAYHQMPLGQRNHAQLTLSSHVPDDACDEVVVRLCYVGPPGTASPASAHVAATAAAQAAAVVSCRADDAGRTYELRFDAAKHHTPAEPARQQAARVLVIDDEPLIGKAVRRMLSEHDVTVSTHPDDGLERAARGEFDLVLLDMSLPPSSGRAVFEALTERAPDAASRVVFTSGGISDPDTRDFLDRLPNQVIDKPFDHARIRTLVRRMLERNR